MTRNQDLIRRKRHRCYCRSLTIPPSPLAHEALLGQGVLIIEASRSHSDTPHSAGLLWTSDQPDAETST
jgi:hypothetical protein